MVKVGVITNLILWKPPKMRLYVTVKKDGDAEVKKRQTYSAVLYISSVSLFRGHGMPVLNKNQST